MITFRTSLLAATLTALLSAAACGGHESGAAAATEPMSATFAAVGGALTELDSVLEAHETGVAAVTELAAAVEAESDYEMDIMAIHHDLEALHEHMAMCSHEGAAPDTEDAVVVLDKLDKELSAHETAMTAAADLAAAKAEESRHQTAMASHSDALHAHHEGMQATADQFTCPMADDPGAH